MIINDGRGEIFVSPIANADPERWHAVAAELRRDAPVLRVEAEGFSPFYALTRHADVFEVSRRNDLFVNTRNSVLGPDANFEFIRSVGIEPTTLIHMDGIEHRDHRHVANDWFKPAAVQRWQGAIDAIADEFVARLADHGGRCDFARDIAVPYTLRVIMSIFGVPREDERLMLELTQGIFGAADPEYFGDIGDPLTFLTRTIERFDDYFEALAEDRRAHPTDDLATVIANGEIDGRPMDRHARLWYFIIVATAGHDTTSYALAGGLEALLRRPEQVLALAADPSLATNATEEMIRWTSPVRQFLRYAVADTEVAGVPIGEGERVLLSYPSANRDDAVFADPMRFDITRPDADRHLAFGLGVHYCLGSQFARREVRTMLPKLLDRVATIELDGEPRWAEANFVGGVKRLPIRYTLR